MSRRSDEMTPKEQQLFINALRDCLGLAPLYGPDVSAGGAFQEVDFVLKSDNALQDKWFVPLTVDNTSREERRDNSITKAIRSRKLVPA